MLHSKGREVRQLGSIRQSVSSLNLNPPPLQINSHYEGISGSAMNIPPPKIPAEIPKKAVETPVPAAVKKPLRSDSAPKVQKKVTKDRNIENKKLTEALEREKELEQRVATLAQLVESLKQEVKEKETSISSLNNQLLAQNENFKILYEREQSSHEITKQNLKSIAAQLEDKSKDIEELKQQHADQVKDMAALLKKCKLDIVELSNSKDKEIAVRDEKLQRLKKQMAEALEGNSKERHYQLEELSKELGKVQEETELLRLKLKNSQKISKVRCSNCDRLNDQIQQLLSAVKTEEKLTTGLKEQIATFKKQLPENCHSKALPKNPSKF